MGGSRAAPRWRAFAPVSGPNDTVWRQNHWPNWTARAPSCTNIAPGFPRPAGRGQPCIAGQASPGRRDTIPGSQDLIRGHPTGNPAPEFFGRKRRTKPFRAFSAYGARKRGVRGPSLSVAVATGHGLAPCRAVNAGVVGVCVRVEQAGDNSRVTGPGQTIETRDQRGD
jgi:hypothetical protein